MKYPTPDRRMFELVRIWQSLTIKERNAWLRMARAMGEKKLPAQPVSLFGIMMVISSALIFAFPFGLRYTLLAIGAGFVLAVNLAIVMVCWEGMRARWSR